MLWLPVNVSSLNLSLFLAFPLHSNVEAGRYCSVVQNWRILPQNGNLLEELSSWIDDEHPVTNLSLANLSLLRSISFPFSLKGRWDVNVDLSCLIGNDVISSVVSPFRVIRKKAMPTRSIPRQQRRIVRQRLISKKSRLIFIGNRSLCKWVNALFDDSLLNFPRGWGINSLLTISLDKGSDLLQSKWNQQGDDSDIA